MTAAPTPNSGMWKASPPPAGSGETPYRVLDQIDVLRDEHKALKDEQRDRIKARDGLIFSVFVAIAAVTGGARFAGPAVPLLLPPVVLSLGWTYLANDRAVSAIGRYIRSDLEPRLSGLVGADMLRWETAHRGDRRRRQRKLIQLGVDLVVFVLPAVVALAWFWGHRPGGVLLAASVAEAAAALLIAWQFVAYAEIGGGA